MISRTLPTLDCVFLKAEAVSDKAWWGQGRCVFPTRIDFPATEVGLQPDACLLLPALPLTPTILFQGWERVLPSFIQIADHILDP